MTEQEQHGASAALAGPDPQRRGFLKALPLGALAAAVGGAASAEPVAAAAPAPATQAGGYRETEHIRRYYRTAAYW
ncbi:formate dehydrogenase [Massilia solisilvae]|uniref:Formate dehydrogenase n=1 Tax=Massilia solisilvae TaxID=1811225 RepID=A0ABT2BGY3_9BURK|nr:formate dehydrogenase [Massilia solisilvae]MCS0607715.1 formate dehydrogenase [Massilia solisilvae]